MAIIGPADLPVVLKIDSNEMKKYVLSMLGHPVTEVELSEDQFETVLKTSGDFIAHYFPKEQKYAYFYTQAMVQEYDLPTDAYWVYECAWDPAYTSITDIFSAEAYLFCFSHNAKVLVDNGDIINIADLGDRKVRTPYGPKLARVMKHEHVQTLVAVMYDGGVIECTPNHLIKTSDGVGPLDGWYQAIELTGKYVVTVDGPRLVKSVNEIASGPTYSIVVDVECLYVSSDGDPILVH